MDSEQQLTSHRLWLTVIDIDLQLYKGSIYKLRWGSPGGLDTALPCYDTAISTLDVTSWPSELEAPASDLRDRIAAYRATLVERDVTTASAQHSRMMSSFDALRELVRTWPEPAPSGASAARSEGRDAMDEAVPGG